MLRRCRFEPTERSRLRRPAARKSPPHSSRQEYLLSRGLPGGTGPYFFSLLSGTLPLGLMLSSSGILSGTPTAPGNFSFTIQATDTKACSGNQSFSITICPNALTCSANVTRANDPNQCGAVVNFPAPTPQVTGCGTIGCTPASGSFFPVGTTTVTCTSTGGASCSFTVRVNDTQAPTIT